MELDRHDAPHAALSAASENAPEGFSFRVEKTCPVTGARAGVLTTPHSVIPTPVFMPVGTQASVKSLSQEEVAGTGARIILGNTYHLYLRPGPELIRTAGGLHKFMSWDGSILTDSGGFQVFSLNDLRTIGRDGVTFRSHIDGSLHKFTPEGVMDIQRDLGADIIMAFDECIPYPADRDYVVTSCRRTEEWAARCQEAFGRGDTGAQQLFGIVQGGTYPDLRIWAAERLAAMDFWGYAIGGVAVGEPKESLFEAVKAAADVLPAKKPRYLMGVGFPDDIVEAVTRGVDMFDCVMPTRNARNGTVFTWDGRVVLKNAHQAREFRPIDDRCGCLACRTYTRAYLRHLFQVGEMLAARLATVHSIYFYQELTREMRTAILEDRFPAWREAFLRRYRNEEISS